MGKRPAMTVLRFRSVRLALVGIAGALACASPPPAPETAAAPAPAPAAAPASQARDLDAQARELSAIPGAEVERKGDVTIVQAIGPSLRSSPSARPISRAVLVGSA